MTPESLEKLVSWKMPFGKHAGTLLADLPGNYLAWFAREGFSRGRTGAIAGADAYDRPQRPKGVVGAAAARAVGRVDKCIVCNTIDTLNTEVPYGGVYQA